MSLLDDCIKALRHLPGVGPKSAQRMLLHILQYNRKGGLKISKLLEKAILEVENCARCHNLTEHKVCTICQNHKRDRRYLCVVESPADLRAIEATGEYNGHYFVLMGRLSPIDGIGPEDIGIPKFLDILATGEVSEIILATNPTVEGEATAYYLSELAKQYGIKATKIAYGVPMGGELEYVDGGTIARALLTRNSV